MERKILKKGLHDTSSSVGGRPLDGGCAPLVRRSVGPRANTEERGPDSCRRVWRVSRPRSRGLGSKGGAEAVGPRSAAGA